MSLDFLFMLNEIACTVSSSDDVDSDNETFSLFDTAGFGGPQFEQP